MSYVPFRKQSTKINLSKLDDYDLYFEVVPQVTVYKIQKAVHRSLRKLKFA